MANVTDIVNYYVNLLIIQYHNQPKAMATIQLFAEIMMANGVMLDVLEGYNLETAVGTQLDIIGKYEGVDRFYRELSLADYFSLETYTEAPPSTPPRYGFTDYAGYDTTPPNGTLIYSEIISANNMLVDAVFRQLIKLKILQNYLNHSCAAIDGGLYSFFGTAIRMEDMYGMHMVYFVTAAETALIVAALYKKVLPKPMAVGALIVSDIEGEMFAFTDYTGYESPFGYGFTDYADYDSVAGQVLLYDQITLM